MSWCLCLCFQCDISHSCDTFVLKWKALDLAKMFSWQRMKSVVSASSPGRSFSANQFCLNWRHPWRFVVSKSSNVFGQISNILHGWCYAIGEQFCKLCLALLAEREKKFWERIAAVTSLCYHRNREHWLSQACWCSGCFVFDASKELPSGLLLIS